MLSSTLVALGADPDAAITGNPPICAIRRHNYTQETMIKTMAYVSPSLNLESGARHNAPGDGDILPTHGEADAPSEDQGRSQKPLC